MKGVEEFEGLLRDVGAQKGVLVCPKGFTDTAKKRAEGLQIDLYSPVEPRRRHLGKSRTDNGDEG